MENNLYLNIIIPKGFFKNKANVSTCFCMSFYLCFCMNHWAWQATFSKGKQLIQAPNRWSHLSAGNLPLGMIEVTWVILSHIMQKSNRITCHKKELIERFRILVSLQGVSNWELLLSASYSLHHQASFKSDWFFFCTVVLPTWCPKFGDTSSTLKMRKKQ